MIPTKPVIGRAVFAWSTGVLIISTPILKLGIFPQTLIGSYMIIRLLHSNTKYLENSDQVSVFQGVRSTKLSSKLLINIGNQTSHRLQNKIHASGMIALKIQLQYLTIVLSHFLLFTFTWLTKTRQKSAFSETHFKTMLIQMHLFSGKTSNLTNLTVLLLKNKMQVFSLFDSIFTM